MKHIIEKHVTKISEEGVFKDIGLIRHQEFPALISDLEAEMCKFAEWCISEHYPVGIYWEDRGGDRFTTAELLKIYQNKQK